jgi:lipoprotein NlpD
MRRLAHALASLSCVVLAGCSVTQPAAPIREAGPAKRPLRVPARPAPLPDLYRIQPGDNLYRIAFDHGLDYRRLAAWNGLDDPARIRAGDILRLKAPGPGVPAPVDPDELPADVPVDWTWPARGEVVTRFDGNAGAKGLDIAGLRGSAVLAAAGGRVLYVGAGLRGYGKLIIIKHNAALLSAYGHNDKVLVAEGQMVKQGQAIAEMGSTDADRVKLYFEIREYGKPVDPTGYLPTT